jgi:hypothetical protein
MSNKNLSRLVERFLPAIAVATLFVAPMAGQSSIPSITIAPPHPLVVNINPLPPIRNLELLRVPVAVGSPPPRIEEHIPYASCHEHEHFVMRTWTDVNGKKHYEPGEEKTLLCHSE